jgi:hypothetical protein
MKPADKPASKMDPNLIKGVAALVKQCADDDPLDPKIPWADKLATYKLAKDIDAAKDKLEGTGRKGSRFRS